MKPEIEQLVNLQALDLERTRLRAQLAALPAEVTKAEAELAQATKAVAAARTALASEDAMRTQFESGIDRHRKKSAHLRSQLDAVTTQLQAQAIEHEIQFNDDEANRLEAEAFASLERTEAQESALAAAQTHVNELNEALVKIRARALGRQNEYQAELATLAVTREAMRPLIDADLLARFDRIASKNGTGLARAENQQCTSCRMGVRPQIWNTLREGQLLNCDSCGRLLYWDPALFVNAPHKDGK